MRDLVAAGIVALAVVCGESRANAQPVSGPSGRCGDVVGAWSAVSDGLRMRLITSGSRPDRSALRIEVEIENTSARGVELHWEGRFDGGWASPGMRDLRGVDVPAPPWAFGGNEYVGRIRLPIAARHTTRIELAANAFTPRPQRSLRIGAFWARQMPTDGRAARFYVRTRTSATALASPATLVRNRDGSHTAQQTIPGPRFAVWRGSIEVPSVCVD